MPPTPQVPLEVSSSTNLSNSKDDVASKVFGHCLVRTPKHKLVVETIEHSTNQKIQTSFVSRDEPKAQANKIFIL